MMKLFEFGEQVSGYDIPVMNEREIRAGAGILFLVMFVAIMTVIFEGKFILLKYTITIFLTDMLIRVLINPKFSPSLILGRFMVKKQQPIYVGAPQKKFAWMIGIAISSLLFYFLVVRNQFSDALGLACLLCLLFLFCETAFSICIGCKIYAKLMPGEVKHCPGEVCTLKDRQDIQKTSKEQWWFLLLLSLILILVFIVSGDVFLQGPD